MYSAPLVKESKLAAAVNHLEKVEAEEATGQDDLCWVQPINQEQLRMGQINVDTIGISRTVDEDAQRRSFSLGSV